MKLIYICKNGHETSTIFNSFQSGKRCMKCGGKEKHTFEYINQYFTDNQCKLLSTEYINTNTKLNYICKNNHICNITFDDFRKGNRCSKCSGNEKFTFEYVNQYFKDNNCKLLSTEYINAHTKLSYICKNNHNAITIFGTFRFGSRCLKCCNEEKKLTYEFVYNYFKINGYTLLSTEYKNAMTKMQFLCNNNHKSSIPFNNFQSGIRCGKCKNKTEAIILEFLKNNYNNITFQPSFDWCKNKNKLPFDFLLNDLNILIECDGRQHFSQVSNWQSPDFNLKNDIYKSNLAINNGYKIIRIFQEDVFGNKFNWQELLKESIEFLNNSDEYIIYLSDNSNLYNKHKFELIKKILEDKLSKLKL